MDDTDLFAKADEKILTEILREAELYLQAQLTAAIAADQRAANFSSLLGAAALALGAAGSTLVMGDVAYKELGWTCLSLTVCLVIAALFANRAAMPTKFWYAGNRPSEWLPDLRDGKSFAESLSHQAVHYSEMIDFNNNVIVENNFMMKCSLWIAWGGLSVAAVFAIVLLVTR